MPCKPRKARLLLKNKQAKILKYEPFTIQLLYGSSGYKQKVSLGIDAGSKYVGASATTKKQELYASQTELRGGMIVKLLSDRRELRRSRRSRKTRYRKHRFLNRVHSKHKGWLSPSIENKINTHIRIIDDVYKLLPIYNIIVETASFDIQKLKNKDIEGKEYQEGEQLGFSNVREYVLWRDNHICQCCHGKLKDNILQVHHIESRKIGGNAPNNLITLCKTCHTKYHNGEIKLSKKIHRGMKFKDATFMGIMRWAFYERLKKLYKNVKMTYGYITKYKRIKYNIEKSHVADAFCIANNLSAKRLNYYYLQKQVRRHNRKLHKSKIYKGGYRKNNQAKYSVFGFHLFDKVKYNNIECFVFGRRSAGYFDIRKLNGEVISRSIQYKKLIKISNKKSLLISKEVYGAFSND
jgi:N6-L-threonylcarbamoyladenine synthase